MDNTQIPKGIVIDIQAVDMTINGKLQKQIFKMLGNFLQYFTNIKRAGFHMRQSSKRSDSTRTIRVHLAIPGPDISVSGSGKNWKALMSRVEQNVIRQLKNRKPGTGWHQDPLN